MFVVHVHAELFKMWMRCECDVLFNTSFAVGVLFEELFCVLVVLSFCSKGCVESVESRDVVLVFEGLDGLDVLVFEDIVVYGGWRWRVS
jgi:hypothetical protein